MKLAHAYEPRPLWFRKLCTAVILSGKQQNGETTRAYSVSCSSKTPDANMRSPYGDTLLLELGALKKKEDDKT